MNPNVIIVVIAGLLLGTCLNALIIRLPREQRLGGWPRCTRCGVPLAWWQTLPLLGWLAQGGRARCCGRALSPLFPLVELITAGVLVVFYLQYGLSTSFWYLCFIAAVLILTGAIDWLHRSIYTFVILGSALLGVLATAIVPKHSFLNAFLGALIAGMVFLFFFALARLLFPGKSSPFGLGDVYLGIFIGAAVGLTNLMPSLFYGIVLAGIFSAILIIAKRVGRMNVPEYISYGTFLCVGTLGYLLRWGLAGM